VREILRHLGYAMTRENRDAEPATSLEARLYQPELDALRQPLERVPRWRVSLRPFLDDVARKTGILGPHDGPDADWRFWHRTFREALAAERLEQIARSEGNAALLALAREIAGDESRWAEPYALLTGRIADPDALVCALVEANRSLGLRALATAPELRPETLTKVLALSEKWQERAEVYRRLPELVGDPERALGLLDRLRRRTRDGNDLYFLDLAVRSVGDRWPDQARKAADLLRRLYDHIPPPEDLFRWIDTPADGRVPFWREIPAGRFWMGSPEGEGDNDERPRHEVVLPQPFQISVVPVTNAQYAAFDPHHKPTSWPGVSEEELPFHPAESVTWFAAMSFCRWLAARAPCAHGARLPLEGEWEYACRAGTETRYWSGDEEEDLGRVGWYDANSEGRTHRVGEKPASAWGLYDMHGNVWEWTASPYTERYEIPEGGVILDPTAVELPPVAEPSGEGFVVRGGSYWDDAVGSRAAYRYIRDPGLEFWDRGFRVVLPGAPSSRLPSPDPLPRGAGEGENDKLGWVGAPSPSPRGRVGEGLTPGSARR
jgi:formylglycine-generating enzyme required for sulfatase activity